MASLGKKFIISVLRVAFKILYFVNHWIFALLQFGEKKTVPPIEDAILLMSATALAAEMREGKIKCEVVMQSYLRRIREVGPYINAVAEERFQEAMEEAREVDALFSSKVMSVEQLEREKPFLGVPLSVKALISVKGLRCTACSLQYKDLKAFEDADVVTLMKEAGAICIATTNSPEFGLGFQSHNYVYGRTSNPYDTRRTSGGSSGGEGALIGSAASVIGLGNDMGGSIRLPSSFNCIFGHKPSRGVVSNMGCFPRPNPVLNNYIYTGPICRYAEDLVPAMKVLAGSKAANMKFGTPVNFSELKVYYIIPDGKSFTVPKIENDIMAAYMKAVHHFEKSHGIKAKKADLKNTKYAVKMWIYTLVQANNIAEIMSGGKDPIDINLELLKVALGLSKFNLPCVLAANVEKFPFVYHKKYVPRYQAHLRDLDSEFQALLDENSIILFPTFARHIPYHSEMQALLPLVAFMCIFNLLGLPVTQCPLGLNADGLPMGLQVVGAMGKDHLTIACATEIGKAFGGWIPPKA